MSNKMLWLVLLGVVLFISLYPQIAKVFNDKNPVSPVAGGNSGGISPIGHQSNPGL